jgi:hypothetical protein
MAAAGWRGPRIQVLFGVAPAQVLPIGKDLAVFHHRQVEVDPADHLSHRAAVAIAGLLIEGHLTADRQALLQVAAGLPPWRTRMVSPSPFETTVALRPWAAAVAGQPTKTHSSSPSANPCPPCCGVCTEAV